MTGVNAMKHGVKFSVEANSDIHISITNTNPHTDSSWEVVLGAGKGTFSTIRSGNRGPDLVVIFHTKAQFLEVRENKIQSEKVFLNFGDRFWRP